MPKPSAMLPAKTFVGSRRIGTQNVHLGRTIVARVDCHMLRPVEANTRESQFNKALYAVALTRPYHVIVRLVLLEHEPHSFHVFRRISPVALRIHVADIECFLQPGLYSRGRPGDLAGNKGFAAAR